MSMASQGFGRFAGAAFEAEGKAGGAAGDATSPFDAPHLAPRPQNFVPLTPLTFIERAASAFGARTAVIHGDLAFTWEETYARCRRLASALSARGIGAGDTVALLLPNTPAMLEAHYAMPMLGAVMNPLNTRLDAASIRFMLEHGEAKAILVDTEYADVATAALDGLGREILVVDVADAARPDDPRIGAVEYEALLSEGDPAFAYPGPRGEWDSLSLLYTSGTTGNPKGVVYHHRGGYLSALGNALTLRLAPDSVYLWTLPMFHCNGWTFTWAVTAAGGTHVCLRRVDTAMIFSLIARHKVTHLCGAPIVLNMIAHAPAGERVPFDHQVLCATGGAAPPSTVIRNMEALGIKVMHLYGATETYGPSVGCFPAPEWETMPEEAVYARMARQGQSLPMVAAYAVGDKIDQTVLPRDGESQGEILIRANTVMKGYLKNPDATEEKFQNGWCRSGDLAVWHADGAIDIRDRFNDVIISGGENISSLEVEEVLYRHPAILEAAVVAKPDDTWGEVPCAFVTLKDGAEETPDAIIAWCKENMARYKAPKEVVFTELPKTSTGKIQKFVLREKVREA